MQLELLEESALVPSDSPVIKPMARGHLSGSAVASWAAHDAQGRPDASGMRDGRALLLPVDHVYEGPDNPRTVFPEVELEVLAHDIRQRGILQPIVVHPADGDGRHRIHFGAMRLRAAVRAGLNEVPVVVRDMPADSYAQVAENLKRQNLSPLELAQFIRRRVDAGDSSAEVGRQLGMDLTTVAHHLALLGLPPVLDQLLKSGRCDSPRTLHELSRLYEEQPDQVAALVTGAASITREAVARLRDVARAATPAADKPAPSQQRPDKVMQALARATGLCDRLDAALQRLNRSGGIDALPPDQVAALRQRVAALAVRWAPESTTVNAEADHGTPSA